MSKKTPSNRTLREVSQITYMRGQVDLLARLNQNLGSQVNRAAEIIGQIVATARPLIDQIHTNFPDVGEESCELPKDLQQAIISHRRVILGLLPKNTEEANGDSSTTPGFPEGAEGPDCEEDPERPPMGGSRCGDDGDDDAEVPSGFRDREAGREDRSGINECAPEEGPEGA